MKLRKIISATLSLFLLVAAFSIFGVVGFAESAPVGDTAESAERLGVGEGAYKLDGKKILIAGCSFSYYGGFVERTGGNKMGQAERTSGETGLFKRICNLNGAKVTVTDWTYGGHDLTDLFDGSCAAEDENCPDRDHLADLTDRNYDIVILQDIVTPGYKTAEEYVENVRMAMTPFLEVNPDTEIYLLVHHRYYQSPASYAPLTDSVQLVKDRLGINVIDWGSLIYDVTEGIAKVEGSNIDYNYHSFVVSNSKADGYHQNLLAGYLTSIITYASLTGETTVGQPYKFIYDLTSKYLNIDKYISSYYKYDNPDTAFNEKATNMKEIFYSDVDMLGLQKLADEYLTKERWLDFAAYDVEFYADGKLLSSGEYAWGEEIDVPAVPEKESDNKHNYTFIGWDKDFDGTCRGNAKYTAVYEEIARKYTVTFLDDDGTVLANGEYAWGDAVTAPTVATKEDAEYKYTFKSWDNTVTECRGDAVYIATYVRVGQGYVISFRNFDGTLISASNYNFGDNVSAPENPVRPSDNTYTYVFAGWDKEIVACAGDATYTATYVASYIDYTVRFLNEDGTLISEAVYHWGDEVGQPEAPTKEATNVYTYTFAGWGDIASTCSGNAEYTATYTENYVLYNIVFFDENGEVISSMTRFWGQEVVAPEAPPKPDEEGYRFVFAGWNKEVTDCTGNESYHIVYDKIPLAEDDFGESTPPESSDESNVNDGGSKEKSIIDIISEFFKRLIEWLKSIFKIEK